MRIRDGLWRLRAQTVSPASTAGDSKPATAAAAADAADAADAAAAPEAATGLLLALPRQHRTLPLVLRCGPRVLQGGLPCGRLPRAIVRQHPLLRRSRAHQPARAARAALAAFATRASLLVRLLVEDELHLPRVVRAGDIWAVCGRGRQPLLLLLLPDASEPASATAWLLGRVRCVWCVCVVRRRSRVLPGGPTC